MGVENLMDPTQIKWVNSPGPEGDIVISSRVRLARNLNNALFPIFYQNKKAKNRYRSILNSKGKPCFLS